MIGSLKTTADLCLCTLPENADEDEQQHMKVLHNFWRQLNTMPWGHDWSHSLSTILPLLNCIDEVHELLTSGPQGLYVKVDWHDMDLQWRLAMTAPEQNLRFHQVNTMISESSFYPCTAGDALLKILLIAVSDASRSTWQARGEVVPRSFIVKAGAHSCLIVKNAGENYNLARFFDLAHLGRSLGFTQLDNRQASKSSIHVKGDVVEHILALLMLDTTPRRQLRHRLACFITHVLIWLAVDGETQK